MAKPRLYVEISLEIGREVTVSGDAHHYLSKVMRMKQGGIVELFDGVSDSLFSEILAVGRRETTLICREVARRFFVPPNLTLAFAPIKKSRTDFIVEKATELGVRNIQIVKTEYTNMDRVNIEKLRRHTIEATEQCGGTYVPNLNAAITSFSDFITNGFEGVLIFCDETADTGKGHADFNNLTADKCTIIIGPEGGFSQNERARLIEIGAFRLSLGPRILRADTAAVSAITLWQNTHGDWK